LSGGYAQIADAVSNAASAIVARTRRMYPSTVVVVRHVEDRASGAVELSAARRRHGYRLDHVDHAVRVTRRGASADEIVGDIDIRLRTY
jgi:hypothetical protein